MTIILGIIQLVLIAVVLFFEYRNCSTAVFLWVVLFIMFGVMHCLSCIIPGFSNYGADVLNEASCFAFLFCIAYLFIRKICVANMKKQNEIELSTNDDKLIDFMSWIFCGSVILYCLVILQNSQGGNISHEVIYKSMANSTKIMLILSYLYFASMSVVVYYCYKKKWLRFFVCAGFVLLKTLISTSRMDLVVLAVAIIWPYILNNRQLKIRKILFLGLMGIGGIYALYLLRAFRYYYTLKDIGKISFYALNMHVVDFLKTENGDLGLRNVFYFFIEKQNQFEGLGEANGLFRLLLLPIPSRFCFGLKPEDLCIIMGRAYKPGFESTIAYTVTPSLFGEWYADMGMVGFFMGGVWGLIVSLIDLISKRKHRVFYFLYSGLSATIYITIGRGSTYNSLAYILYASYFYAFFYFVCYKMRIINLKFSRHVRRYIQK
jgi:oligosaccharide repeat unit polymerase